MLTGDKVETAACIAISTGLKKREESIYYIRDITDKNQLQTMLNSYST
jgi:phospholipid-translocating ATPase